MRNLKLNEEKVPLFDPQKSDSPKNHVVKEGDLGGGEVCSPQRRANTSHKSLDLTPSPSPSPRKQPVSQWNKAKERGITIKVPLFDPQQSDSPKNHVVKEGDLGGGEVNKPQRRESTRHQSLDLTPSPSPSPHKHPVTQSIRAKERGTLLNKKEKARDLPRAFSKQTQSPAIKLLLAESHPRRLDTVPAAGLVPMFVDSASQKRGTRLIPLLAT